MTWNPRTVTAGQSRFGLLLFIAGVGTLCLAALENTAAGLPIAMPRFWHGQRTACLALAIASLVVGWVIMARGPREIAVEFQKTNWQPARAGRRFRTLTLYTRDGCHLCEEAFALLQDYSVYLPPVHEVDIAADPSLRARFDTEVPVVEIDGKVRFRGRVSAVLLRRLIEGTPQS